MGRCETHKCVTLQVVQHAQPICLFEWLAKKALNHVVQDAVEVEEKEKQEEQKAALILDNGFMLPIERATLIGETTADSVKIDLRFSGWRVADLLYVRGENEVMLAEIQADGVDPVLLVLSKDILLYLLFDEEIRKYEP